MTKFEELMDIINRKKGISKTPLSDSNDSHELEVAGSEGSKSPLLECGDDDMDPGLLDQLDRSAKTKPNDGTGAARWD
jgi:hypothetical protein